MIRVPRGSVGGGGWGIVGRYCACMKLSGNKKRGKRLNDSSEKWLV